MKRRILVVDIGGSFVKLLMSERVEREFASGARMTPKQVCRQIQGDREGLEIRRCVDWFSGACTQRTNSPKPEAPGQRLDPFQFCAGTGNTCAHC
jgi:hypothetical protein